MTFLRSSRPSDPPPSIDDLSMDEAVALAQKDYARLLHVHDLRWELDLLGAVHLYCCSDEPIKATSIESHIKESVRKERGPTRGPNNKPKP